MRAQLFLENILNCRTMQFAASPLGMCAGAPTGTGTRLSFRKAESFVRPCWAMPPLPLFHFLALFIFLSPEVLCASGESLNFRDEHGNMFMHGAEIGRQDWRLDQSQPSLSVPSPEGTGQLLCFPPPPLAIGASTPATSTTFPTAAVSTCPTTACDSDVSHTEAPSMAIALPNPPLSASDDVLLTLDTLDMQLERMVKILTELEELCEEQLALNKLMRESIDKAGAAIVEQISQKMLEASPVPDDDFGVWRVDRTMTLNVSGIVAFVLVMLRVIIAIERQMSAAECRAKAARMIRRLVHVKVAQRRAAIRIQAAFRRSILRRSLRLESLVQQKKGVMSPRTAARVALASLSPMQAYAKASDDLALLVEATRNEQRLKNHQALAIALGVDKQQPKVRGVSSRGAAGRPVPVPLGVQKGVLPRCSPTRSFATVFR